VESQYNTQTEVVKPPEGAVQPPEAVRPGSPETPLSFVSSVPVICDDKVSSIPTPADDGELVDCSSSPEPMNHEVNVVHFFVDALVPVEEDFAHLDFGPKDAIFQKPKDAGNHLKALYMKGHINGKPIPQMLVDGGAIVNLMSYSLFEDHVWFEDRWMVASLCDE
jgi:hypothetical protein